MFSLSLVCIEQVPLMCARFGIP